MDPNHILSSAAEVQTRDQTPGKKAELIEELSGQVSPEEQQTSNITCPSSALLLGQPCPSCGADEVGYDRLLNLVCRSCGRTETGAST